MSLFSTLSVSFSGLQATSTQLQLTSNNVANAGQEGYTRKEAILTSASLGNIGGGVKVLGFVRAENATLFTTLTKATTSASMRATQDDYLQQVQTLLGTASSDNPVLSDAIVQFTNAWTQFAAQPESLISERQVIQAGINFTDEMHRISGAVEALDRQCYNDVNSTLGELNNYLLQAQDINYKIAQATNTGQSTGDLEDRRDRVVLSISELTGLTVLQRNFGQIALYTSTGYQLLDGASVREFVYDGTDVTSSANPGLSLNTALAGGKIEALVNFRATTTPPSTDPATSVIQKLRSQLDEVADAFTNLVTTATSGEVTFASAYDAATASTDAVAAHRTLTGALRFDALTAGATGNGISITLAAGTNAGTYQITITDGTTTENVDNVNIGAGPYDWTAMMTAVNTLPSTLVSAAVNGAGTLDPAGLTLGVPYTLYGGADEGSPDELDSGFFTGTDRTSIAVNAALLDGTSTVKGASSGAVVDALLDSTRAFSADGLTLTNASYGSLVTSMMSGFQQSANSVSYLSNTAETQKEYLSQKLTNETNVNIDTEMVNLVTLQQTYTASARVMSVVRDLFGVLESLML